MLVFVIGAVALSVFVLWRRQNCLVFLLGLLGWAVIASWFTMVNIFICKYYSLRIPCPIMPLLSYPLQIKWSLIAYRCIGCTGYDIQIWLGGLWCWEYVSPALYGGVTQARWLIGSIFPWLLWLAVYEALVVFAVVWGLRFTGSWFERAMKPMINTSVVLGGTS